MLSSNRKPPSLQRFQQHNSHILTPLTFILLTLTICLMPSNVNAAIHPVLTYSNASTQLGQLVTSSTLNWETYDPKDPKQLQYAVEGGKYITEDAHYPIYVCRVNIDGVQTSGQTEKVQQSHICAASHYKNLKYKNFDVLINRGHLGKVAWKHWRKFNAGVIVGSIRIGEDAYVARHKAARPATHENEELREGEQGMHHEGADYNLGRLELVGLGKVRVIENNQEKDYDQGEVLIETEPFRYELRDIKLDQIRLDIRDNITDLASGILENRGDVTSLVETVLSYGFEYLQYWGSHEGVARGLPTKIIEDNVANPSEINWGLRLTEKRYETKSVRSELMPGTAINVTLRGNYVTLEAPYTAKLFAFYAGSKDSVSRKISADVRKQYLKDVKLEFSNAYFIENGSFVPTTPRTTTTSTTTHATTGSTGSPAPINEPPMVTMKNLGEVHSGPDSLEKSMHEHASSNEIQTNDKPENLATSKQETPQLAGVGLSHTDNGSAPVTATLKQILASFATLVLVKTLII